MTDRAALDPEQLRTRLGERFARVEVVAETHSTNADLLAEAEIASPPDRSVRIAEYQSGGRGRLDRAWTSPPRAGLTFSVLLRPDVPLPAWGWLPLLTGLAVAEAVERVSGVATALKWPNDLLAGPGLRKAAGILVQSASPAAGAPVAVVGIGLNVSTTADELPVTTATSLAVEGAEATDRVALLVAIVDQLDRWLQQWSAHRGDAQGCGLDAAYRARCATLGRTVRVARADGTTLRGAAVDIDAGGRLVVDHDGALVGVSAGDVEHVRPV